jgi:hypothetical protein
MEGRLVTADLSPLDEWLARARVSPAVRRRKAALVQAWRERVFDGFPPDAADFLRGEGDPFRNPLGHRIRVATERMVDVLVGDAAAQDATGAIDGFVRARALQGHGASTSLRFVFELKSVVRGVMGSDLTAADALDIDAGIDALVLVAFDVFTRCRDEVHEIRMRAERRRVATLIQRFAPIDDPAPGEPEAQG